MDIRGDKHKRRVGVVVSEQLIWDRKTYEEQGNLLSGVIGESMTEIVITPTEPSERERDRKRRNFNKN